MEDEEAQTEEIDVEAIGHPRGTLAIVVIYGLLFAIGWLALYYSEFLSRGTPHP